MELLARSWPTWTQEWPMWAHSFLETPRWEIVFSWIRRPSARPLMVLYSPDSTTLIILHLPPSFYLQASRQLAVVWRVWFQEQLATSRAWTPPTYFAHCLLMASPLVSATSVRFQVDPNTSFWRPLWVQILTLLYVSAWIAQCAWMTRPRKVSRTLRRQSRLRTF